MARNPATLRRFGLGVVSVPVDGHGADPAALAASGVGSRRAADPGASIPDRGDSVGRSAGSLDQLGPPATTPCSSKTTTTENSATTVNRWARWPPSTPNASSTGGRRRRRWPRACGWAGWSFPGVGSSRWWSSGPIVDRHTSALDQLALAEMITSGAYDRHVRHARMRYRRRRDLLLELLADQVPAVTRPRHRRRTPHRDRPTGRRPHRERGGRSSGPGTTWPSTVWLATATAAGPGRRRLWWWDSPPRRSTPSPSAARALAASLAGLYR